MKKFLMVAVCAALFLLGQASWAAQPDDSDVAPVQQDGGKDAKIDLGNVKVHVLTATVDGHTFTGPTGGDLTVGTYTMPGDMVDLPSDKPLQLKIEVQDPSGKRTDVTKDRRTEYHILMGDHISVSPTGLVTAHNDAIPGEESFGFTDQGVVMVQYEDIHGDQLSNPAGSMASVSVRFKILPAQENPPQ